MFRVSVDKIIPFNCPFGKEDCVECGSYELAHDEIICHAQPDECKQVSEE